MAPRPAATNIHVAGISAATRPIASGTAKEQAARGISMAALVPASRLAGTAFGRIDSAVRTNSTAPNPASVSAAPNPTTLPARTGYRNQRCSDGETALLGAVDQNAEGNGPQQMSNRLAGNEDADDLGGSFECQRNDERHRNKRDLIGQVDAMGSPC